MKIIVIIGLIWVATSVGVGAAAKYVEEHGVRSAMLKLWCGKDGCAP